MTLFHGSLVQGRLHLGERMPTRCLGQADTGECGMILPAPRHDAWDVKGWRLGHKHPSTWFGSGAGCQERWQKHPRGLSQGCKVPLEGQTAPPLRAAHSLQRRQENPISELSPPCGQQVWGCRTVSLLPGTGQLPTEGSKNRMRGPS